jgi:hypothetical protein
MVANPTPQEIEKTSKLQSMIVEIAPVATETPRQIVPTGGGSIENNPAKAEIPLKAADQCRAVIFNFLRSTVCAMPRTDA